MSCVVPGCKSHSSRKQNDDVLVTFHRIPNNNEMKTKWLEAINRQNFKAEKRTVCSKHFTKDCFMNEDDTRWRRLKPEAVPTLLLQQCKQALQNTMIKTENVIPQTCAKVRRMVTENENEIPCSSTEIKTEDPLMLPDVTDVSQYISKDEFFLHMNNPSQNYDQSKMEQSVELHRNMIENERLKKRLSKIIEISKCRLLKIKALKQKNRRLMKKNDDLIKLLEHLLNNGDISL